jgi:hypothetical protein
MHAYLFQKPKDKALYFYVKKTSAFLCDLDLNPHKEFCLDRIRKKKPDPKTDEEYSFFFF